MWVSWEFLASMNFYVYNSKLFFSGLAGGLGGGVFERPTSDLRDVRCTLCEDGVLQHPPPPVSDGKEDDSDSDSDNGDDEDGAKNIEDDDEKADPCPRCEGKIPKHAPHMQCSSCGSSVCLKCTRLDRELAMKTKKQLADLCRVVSKELPDDGSSRYFSRMSKKQLLPVYDSLIQRKVVAQLKAQPGQGNSKPSVDIHGRLFRPGSQVLRVGERSALCVPHSVTSQDRYVKISSLVSKEEAFPQEVTLNCVDGVDFTVRIDPPPGSGVGISLSKVTDEEGATCFKVVDVEQGSEAYRIGVAVGDRVVSVNRVADLSSWTQAMALLEDTPVFFTLNRHSVAVTARSRPGYKRKDSALIKVNFFDEGLVGDDDSRTELDAFVTGGSQASYLRKQLDAKNKKQPLTMEDVALSHLKESEKEVLAKDNKGMGLRTATQQHPLPCGPVNMDKTGLKVMIDLVRHPSVVSCPSHDEATRLYVEKKHLPQLAEDLKKEAKVNKYIVENWEAVKAHVEKRQEHGAKVFAEGMSPAEESAAIFSASIKSLEEQNARTTGDLIDLATNHPQQKETAMRAQSLQALMLNRSEQIKSAKKKQIEVLALVSTPERLSEPDAGRDDMNDGDSGPGSKGGEVQKLFVEKPPLPPKSSPGYSRFYKASSHRPKDMQFKSKGGLIYKGNVDRVRKLGFPWLKNDHGLLGGVSSLGIALKVRVTDYFQSNEAKMFAGFATRIGAETNLEMDLRQIGYSCGVVAPIVICHRRPLGSGFFTDPPVGASVEPSVITRDYDWLRARGCDLTKYSNGVQRETTTTRGVETPFCTETELHLLLAKGMNGDKYTTTTTGGMVLSEDDHGTAQERFVHDLSEDDARDMAAKECPVLSFDEGIFILCKKIDAAGKRAEKNAVIKSMVVNTGISGESGQHWFSVMYEISSVAADPSPLV